MSQLHDPSGSCWRCFSANDSSSLAFEAASARNRIGGYMG
jgi:hypothetical protein